MLNHHRLLSSSLPLLALCGLLASVQPASADILYDIQTTRTHQTFTVPTILTSSTVITSFLMNTSTISSVTQLALSPVATGTCAGLFVGIFGPTPGPCLDIGYANGSEDSYRRLPVYASLGTFVGPLGSPTITISDLAAVPEPSSAVLSLAGMGALLGLVRTRRNRPARM